MFFLYSIKDLISLQNHDDVIKWKDFRVTDPLWGESADHRWIPLTEASNAERWYFPWSAPGQTVEQTIETPVIWDAIAFIMTSLQWVIHYSLYRWIDNEVHWKYITSYKQMMIIMKITMMIMMMIMWGLYNCNLLSHMYMWYCKCQNVTHLNSWSSIATQSLTYADTAPGILQI